MADIIWFQSLLKSDEMTKLAEKLKVVIPAITVDGGSVVSQDETREI